MYLGFTSPNQMMFDKYARHGEGILMVADKTDFEIVAKFYSGYIGGGMAVITAPLDQNVWLRLCRIDDPGVLVDVATSPITLAGSAATSIRWVIKRGIYPDGNYEVTSNIPGTLGFTFQIRNNAAAIPPAKYVVQRPAYMPFMGGFPTNIKTNIIEYQGVRQGSAAKPVPFINAGVFDKPFLLADLWSESFGTNCPDYDGVAWPSVSPLGGRHYVAKQRYTINDYASVVPDIEGNKAIPKSEACYDHSPSERLDGVPGMGGAGVVPSGFKASNGEIYILSSTGSIIHVNQYTRAMTTVYGWVKKPGMEQPVASGLLLVGAVREAWLKQYFDFVGTGPTIARAWQMCCDGATAYVTDATNHTVVVVDLITGIGRYLAGTPGVKGWMDGAANEAKFDQPRGIGLIKSGIYADRLVVADEHNSAYRLVNKLTGDTSTLTRAKKIPTIFPGDFSATDLTRKINRRAFGAPTNLDGTYNAAFKIQPFNDAQFCHPCHLAVLSDGKTVIGVHHDEYRGFKLDLDAQTITHLFDFEAAATRADVSPKDWPTIHADTNGSMGYGIDSLWVCGWHYNNMDVYSPAGARLFGNWIGWGTCGDHRGLRHNAYNRAMIVLGDGTFIYNGDGQNSLCRVRKAIPSDPAIDRARYDRGNALYRADGLTRASVLTINGSVGVNYLVQFKTPGELAMLSFPERKKYMLDNFSVTDWSDADHADVSYYLDWNCSQGVQRMRDPTWGDVAPIPQAPPVVIPATVTNTAPIDSTAAQQLSFDVALQMVREGAAIKSLTTGKVIVPTDLSAVDWVVL